MNMNKNKLLIQTISNAEELKSKLRILSLQGVFECILIEKISDGVNNEISKIRVKTLINENPEFEENQELELELFNGGLIEIQIIE